MLNPVPIWLKRERDDAGRGRGRHEPRIIVGAPSKIIPHAQLGIRGNFGGTLPYDVRIRNPPSRKRSN